MKILKYILTLGLSFFLFSPVFSQNDPGTGFSEKTYEQLWNQVAGYKTKGLPKSSLEVVEKVIKKAEAEKNSAELVKALIHKLIYLQDVEEDTFVMSDGFRAVVRSREQKQMRALYLDWTFKNL